jgi:hypothetical protein
LGYFHLKLFFALQYNWWKIKIDNNWIRQI